MLKQSDNKKLIQTTVCTILILSVCCLCTLPVFASNWGVTGDPETVKKKFKILANVPCVLCSVAGVVSIVLGIGEYIMSFEDSNANMQSSSKMRMAFGIILLMASAIIDAMGITA